MDADFIKPLLSSGYTAVVVHGVCQICSATNLSDSNTKAGSKDDKEFTPSGLIERSKTSESDGVIFVALNYRLGLFGFLNSHGDDRIDANAGLLDQRQAIEW